jgi:hypothetical protein
LLLEAPKSGPLVPNVPVPAFPKVPAPVVLPNKLACEGADVPLNTEFGFVALNRGLEVVEPNALVV